MLGIVGTIPDKDFPMVCGRARLAGDRIEIGEESLAINRGTPAMVAAAMETLQHLSMPEPYCWLVGDIGDGAGCRKLYAYLEENLSKLSLKTLALHYFQPDVVLFKKLLAAIEALPVRPTLIGDAGFMYVAKMGGDAAAFDLFTPDAGELAYLADEETPHPFYTRGFILHEDNQVPDLVKRAYEHGNAASYLLVKGATDYVVHRGDILDRIHSPLVEALEPIGGTGDTITGIVSALIHAGLDIPAAASRAAAVNRLAGELAQPTPATQIYDIIRFISPALDSLPSQL